jgi:hypothetical protein
MSCEPIFAPSILKTDKLQLLSSVFERLWRVDGAAAFGKLLRRIDEALVQRRCHTRIVRLHRMLEREYCG